MSYPSNKYPPAPTIQPTFQSELDNLVKKWHRGAPSKTKDYIVTQYILACLAAWDRCVIDRSKWPQ